MSDLSTLSVPRQVRLTACRLFSPRLPNDTGIDIRRYVGTIDIFESIFDNTLSARLHVRESDGWIELLPIVGVESIVLSFEIDYPDAANAQRKQKFTRAFRVRRVGDQSFPQNETREYTLDLVTPEFLTSLSSRISRHLTGKIDDNVLALIRGLNPTRLIDIEPCRGLVDAVIPNYTPLQAINFLSILALTKDAPDENSFMFYETLDGFHFVSLRRLMGRPVARKYEINTQLLGSLRPDQARSFNTIIKLHQDQTFDVAQDIVTGMLRSKMLSLDIFSRKWTETDSRYTEFFKSAVSSHVAPHPVYPENFDQTIDRNVKIFVVPTNTATATGSAYQRAGGDATEVNIHKAAMLRNRQMKSLMHLTTKLQVPGQPDIRAGSLIDLVYPSTRLLQGGSIDTPQATHAQLPTPFHSGKHLVTSVHHQLVHNGAFSMEYRMELEAVRNALSKPVGKFAENATDRDRAQGN